MTGTRPIHNPLPHTRLAPCAQHRLQARLDTVHPAFMNVSYPYCLLPSLNKSCLSRPVMTLCSQTAPTLLLCTHSLEPLSLYRYLTVATASSSSCYLTVSTALSSCHELMLAVLPLWGFLVRYSPSAAYAAASGIQRALQCCSHSISPACQYVNSRPGCKSLFIRHYCQYSRHVISNAGPSETAPCSTG